MTEYPENIFDVLYKIDVNDKTEKKGSLTYLSWAWAWAEVKKKYPHASYEVWRDPETNLPYVHDPKTGYMVFVDVKVDGITHSMWLPVMNHRNQALENPTMTDINKTIMRCLAKGLAMHGLGLYIYAGEDLPEPTFATKEQIEELKNLVSQYAKESGGKIVELEAALLEQYKVGNFEHLYDTQINKIISQLKERTQ